MNISLKQSVVIIGAFSWLLISASCISEPVVEENESKVQNEYIQRVKYELEGDTVYETLHFKNDSVVYMERIDEFGNFLKDHRAIDGFPISDKIKIGEKYKSSLFIYGDRPCDKLMYYVSEPIPIDEETKGKKLIRRYDVRNDTAFFELTVDKPGEYYYVGVIVISCDTVSYPRQYQLRGEFSVTEE